MAIEHEERARRYARAKRALWLLDQGLTLLFLGGLILSGLSQRMSHWVSAHFTGWPLQTFITVGLLGGAMALLAFPLDWFGSFYLEHRFGLSNQRPPQWFLDYGKRLLIGGAFGLIVVEGLVTLIRLDPEGWWLWTAFAWMGWSTLLTWVAPNWLIPLFYRQQVLNNPALQQRLESLLNRCKTKVHGIFEVDLSRTTKKANACLCGMGSSRRVLVSDTLARAYPEEEIEVVIAHEVGHHRLHHLGILIGSSTLAAGFSCFIVHQLLQGRPIDLAALPLLGLGFFLLGLLGMPITNGLSRWLETAADRFALRQTDNPAAFIATMRRLAEQNLAEVDPPRWVEWLFYDHPSIARRIALARGIP